MITINSTEAPGKLIRLLDAAYTRGELAYGFSIGKTSLITCMVLERNGRHLHFVDGSNGGYPLVSKDLKLRMAAMRQGV